MQPTPSANPLTKWLNRMTKRLNAESPEFPGAFTGDSGGHIDDGHYGDAHEDTRPEWVKALVQGWEPVE